LKVSALVSTYNSSAYLTGCLEDLIKQTLYQKGLLEIIVIDSGSEENEGEMVRLFQKQYTNIKYLRTENRESLYAAWSQGIQDAEGVYLCNANTDDRHDEEVKQCSR
jgi:glycosyltransferase involved in cell wall biosynthesis